MPKNYWKEYAPRMDRDGWPIVLLHYKDKIPVSKGWQKGQLRPEAIKRLAEGKHPYGIGIRCGNVIGIDIDYELSDVVTQEFLDALDDLTNHYFPEALLRLGRRTRLPLRCIRLEGKAVRKSINIDKVQILGVGKQFVAYNIHPDIEKPYVWLKKGTGSPVNIAFTDVPAYSLETLNEFIAAVGALEDAFSLGNARGATILDKIKDGEEIKPEKLVAPSREALEKACEYITNEEGWNWDDWNENIMMPLYNASGGEDWGLELAEKLSEGHDIDVEERWNGIGKSPAKYLGWPRLHWLARQGGMPFQGPSTWDDFRLVMDQEAFYNVKTSIWMSDKMFNNKFVAHRTKGKDPRTPTQNFLETREEQCVDKMAWDPMLPHGRVQRAPLWLWNTWNEPDWYGEEGDGNIEPWLEVMKIVYVEHWELAIKRMAYDVQYPTLRPQWHLQAIGDNGIGKSDSIMPLSLWADRFGLKVNVRNEMLRGQFNSYLSKKKIIIHNEPAGITDALFNEIKDMLAGHENKISIRSLYKNPVDESIVASWYFGGNKQNALSLTDVERRVFPVHSHALTPSKKNGLLGPAVKRHKWLVKHWQQVIWYLRNIVEVDRDFGSVFPGVNRYQKQIASVTAPVHLRMAEYIKEILRDKYVFTLANLQTRMMNGHDIPIEPKDLSYAMIAKALNQMGASACTRANPIRVEGEKKRLWSLDSTLENAGSEQLRVLWDLQDGETEDPTK